MQQRENSAIWSAFGAYIAKEMMNGRGVTVPKFGHFTFTASELDMQGTTNPHVRDKQLRKPVFMVGKDFSAQILLRTGIASTTVELGGLMTVLPLELRGASGVIPKVKINYIELGTMTGEGKETCREVCELIFKHLSDQVHNDPQQQFQTDIPHVGRFIIRNNVAAICFNPELSEQTKGVTTRAFTVGNLFSSSNATLNLKLNDYTRARRRDSMRLIAGTNQLLSSQPNGGNHTLDPLKADKNNFVSPQPSRPSSKLLRTESNALLNQNDETSSRGYKKLSVTQSVPSRRFSRPMSVAPSQHTTEMATHMSYLPPTDRFCLQQTAQNIFQARQKITQIVLSQNSNSTLRDVMSSGQMIQIFKKAKAQVELIELKQLLHELSFPYNGPSSSLTALIAACKAYLQGATGKNQGHLNVSEALTEYSGLTPRAKDIEQGSQAKRVCDLLRDVIYASGKSLFELFQIGANGKNVDREGFEQILTSLGANSVKQEDVEQAWDKIQHKGQLTFQQFERVFSSETPTGADFETIVIRQVREWMHRNSLSSEMAFDALCRSVGKFHEKRLNRALFHRACTMNELGLSAVKVDSLYTALCVEANGEIDWNMWKSRIYHDGDNPLQMVREIVLEYGLTQDDMLFTMHLKPWSDPLNAQQLSLCLHYLDKTISEQQIFALFRLLRNKEGLIPVPILISNLTGQPYETVEFRNKVFKKLYADIYPSKEEELMQAFCQKDARNCGRINSSTLLEVLLKFIKSVSAEDCERFVRYIETDRQGLIAYMDLVGDLQKFGNKDHNPFKTIVNRIKYFLQHNFISPAELVRRLKSSPEKRGVPIDEFAKFLKQKVDKKRDLKQLSKFVALIDIDKDGQVSGEDVEACIRNLHNTCFWQNEGAALAKSTFNSKTQFFPRRNYLSEDKIGEVLKQINEEMYRKQITYGECFDICDSNKDNMVSYAEFSRGLSSVLTIALPVLEQIYALMDKTGVGLVNYQQFIDVLKSNKITKPLVNDNFDWEVQTIQRIKEWIISKQCSVDEAFKLFDHDFDGVVSKSDLRYGLQTHLGISSSQINSAQLDRLFRLLDFFKIGRIQLSDFRRVIQGGINPYMANSLSRGQLAKTLGGIFMNTSTFDWKFCSIQQIGLVLSRRYQTLKASFKAAALEKDRVNYADFTTFISKQEALKGLNLTESLVKQLFCDLDSHKKGYLVFQDWLNAFKAFDWKNQLLIELQDAMQSNFVDCSSAFNFFSSAESKQAIGRLAFKKAVVATVGDHCKDAALDQLWEALSKDGKISEAAFRKLFEKLSFAGVSKVQFLKSKQKSKSTERATLKTSTSQSQKWSGNAMEKLRGLIAASYQSPAEILSQCQVDENGQINLQEFRQSVRRLGLGLTSRDIDALMVWLDTNGDMKIDVNEFLAMVSETKLQSELRTRVKAKLGRLKELMVMHMTSFNDAFRYVSFENLQLLQFDPDGEGQLAFQDFSRLVHKVHELANEKPPVFSVVKDLFETVDIRKDGVIDLAEWQQAFGRVHGAEGRLSLRPAASEKWENTKQFERIGFLVAKNRKQLMEKFQLVCQGRNDTLFSFREGKAAFEDWLHCNFQSQLTDEQLRCLFRAGTNLEESQLAPSYDYVRMLDIFKQRHAAAHGNQ